jgi:hypothetical protein
MLEIKLFEDPAEFLQCTGGVRLTVSRLPFTVWRSILDSGFLHRRSVWGLDRVIPRS